MCKITQSFVRQRANEMLNYETWELDLKTLLRQVYREEGRYDSIRCKTCTRNLQRSRNGKVSVRKNEVRTARWMETCTRKWFGNRNR